MLKKVALAVVVLITVALVFNAGKDAGKESVTTTTIPPTTTTTVDTGRQDCADRLERQADQFDSLSRRSDNIDVTNPVSVRRFIDDSRQAISEGRSFVRDCGKYAPVQMAEYEDTLDEVEASLDQAEDTYNLLYG